MPVMDFPSSPINGQTTTDGRYYFDSSVGSTGAWRSTPLPVGGLPAGSIMAWGTNTPPANWLLADGSAVSRSVYSSLFAVIGTQYGAGDGTTTFNLPDLRGRVPVGRNGGTFGTLGATGGAETHTLTEAQMPSHNHTQNPHSHLDALNFGGSQSLDAFGGYTYNSVSRFYVPTSQTTATNNPTGGGQPHNNLQPYQVVNYIIKASAGWTAGDSELATRLGVVEQRQILSPNYVLNGGFDIWQRGTSVTVSSGYGYGPDRWRGYSYTANSFTMSQQTFTPGTAPVAELAYFLRFRNSSTRAFAETLIEDVRTLSGKTATLSFWAKAPAGTTLTAHVFQNFGSGGSAVVTDIVRADSSLSTSWQRFSRTFVMPSLAGKTIGSGSYIGVELTSQSLNTDIDICGVQLEEGSIPTPFRRNAPSIQAELAACQRYYYRLTAATSSNGYPRIATGYVLNGTTAEFPLKFPVPMRTIPYAFEASAGTTFCTYNSTSGVLRGTSIVSTMADSSNEVGHIQLTISGAMTMSQSIGFLNYSGTTSYVGWSAEL